MSGSSFLPRHRYHPEKGSVLVKSKAQEEALGEGWFDSPARYGVETCPGIKPDPVIAKLAEEYKNSKGSDLVAKKPKRGRA